MTDEKGTRTPRVGVVVRPQLSPPRQVEVARVADEAGLDDVWMWEDCFREGAFVAATAALAATGSIRVGVGLFPVPLRNPALAAMELATVAELFPGRLAPAVGHGVLDWMDQVGARVDSPMTLLREWSDAVQALLRGETVTVSGRYVRLRDVALDWPPTVVPPLMIGGWGPRTIALAGEITAGTIVDSTKGTADVQRAREAARRPDHDVVAYLLAAFDEQAERRHRTELPSLDPVPEGVIAEGGVEGVTAAVRRFAAAGATTVVLQPTADEPDLRRFVELAAAVRASVNSP